MSEIESQYERNGNAFAISRFAFPIAYVWSYDDSEVVIVELWRGRVHSSRRVSTSVVPDESLTWTPEEDIRSCSADLDGGLVVFKLTTGSVHLDGASAVDIECLSGLVDGSSIVNYIARDIRRFDLVVW